MDKFKWYSSHSVMMDQIAIGSSPFSKSFIEDAYQVFNDKKPGINSLLYIYMRVNKRSNKYRNFYEIFFSIDGKLLEIKDLNPSVDGDPFYVVEVSSGRKTNNTLYNSVMNFILESIVRRNGMNISSQMSQEKSIAILQIDFDEYSVKTDEITRELRMLFDRHFVDVIGPM